MGTNEQVGEVLLRNVLVVAPLDDPYRPGESTVVLFELYNGADQPDALIGVRSRAAAEVRMHWDRSCDGIAEAVPRIPVLPEGTVPGPSDGRPGGTPYYLEIEGLTEVVRPGTTFPVTFFFERAGDARVDALVQVVGDGAVPPPPPCRP